MKVHALSLHSFSSSVNPHSISPLQSSPNPYGFIKFRTSYREDLRYLKTLGLIRPNTTPRNLPLPDAAAGTIAAIEFLKSRGFTDADIPRLAIVAPDLFSPTIGAAADTHCAAAVDAVLSFLAEDVTTSPEDSRLMILRCPSLLFSDVEYCLRPTLDYLRRVGLQRLNSPTNLNAHLLNTRVDKLQRKLRFLRSLGINEDEATKICARIPAIFGYSIENNLRPKYEYLVWEMARSLEELKRFPQYFGFSLEKRIAPRHLHLRKRNVKIPLNRMLQWGDQKFYARWK